MITRTYLSIKYNYLTISIMLKQCSFPGYIQYINIWLEKHLASSFELHGLKKKSKLVWITLKLTHANVSKLVLDEKRCALIKVLLTDANDV